jgi:hypothetical protein
MATSTGRHRPARERTGNRSAAYLAAAGIAIAGLAIGSVPVSAAPAVYYLRGTNIGDVPPDAQFAGWVDGVVTQTAGSHDQPAKVNYPGGFWPVSKGYLGDPTWNRSVVQGVTALDLSITTGGESDAIIFGHSQGAVVATEYLRRHPGSDHTYVLTANPNRPNGGVLQRLNGLYVPILDISFNGSTPTDDATVIDIARQYDGWADFPKYPLNFVATANALMGILFLHGKYDEVLTPEVLAGLEPTTHGNTTYYLVPTARLPLLMPFEGFVPKSVLDTIEAPLRQIVELGYDRTDYGRPTSAGLFPPLGAVTPEVQPQPASAPQPTIAPVSAVVSPKSPRRAGWSRVREVKPDPDLKSGVQAGDDKATQDGGAGADNQGITVADDDATRDTATADTTTDGGSQRDEPGVDRDTADNDENDENEDQNDAA